MSFFWFFFFFLRFALSTYHCSLPICVLCVGLCWWSLITCTVACVTWCLYVPLVHLCCRFCCYVSRVGGRFGVGLVGVTLARCDSIFPLLRCQGVWNKTCTELSLPQILFQNPKNYSLGDVQRFCYHSWCDSTVIFDQISNSINIYLSSCRFWTSKSLVIFYQLPSFSKLRIPSKKFDRSRASFP
jgi:hypothetical protein